MTSIKLVAITHKGTSESRLKTLQEQQEHVWPLKLEVYTGINIHSKEFKYFYDRPCDDPPVKCLMYNTIQILYSFLENQENYLILVEDDVIFVKNFYKRIQHAISIWQMSDVQPSYILRIGFLPLVNKCGEWPIQGAKSIYDIDSDSTLFFDIQQRVLGAQAIVYSKAGARIFLETFTGSFIPRSLKYSTIIEHVSESKVNPAYGITRWDSWGPEKVPATDHLLNLEILRQAILINPLVIESEEGQTSSTCGSIPSKTIWAPLVQKGFIF